jgi:hypothetical protein
MNPDFQVYKKYGIRSLFARESVKGLKGEEYGYLNCIQYLIHNKEGEAHGVKNMCAFATKGCSSMCFGNVKRLKMIEGIKIKRSLLLQNDPDLYLAFYVNEVIRLKNYAKMKKMKLVLRLNGTSDKDFTKMGLYSIFPDVQFCEYTKNPYLVKKYMNDELPRNLHLTLSRSEDNHDFALECLASGLINVAIPFSSNFPSEWEGYPVVSGDNHDLRFLDPTGGHVIALNFKGYSKQLKDGVKSGFIVESVDKKQVTFA